ncbi:DNA methylase N-4/N-6 [uncultured Mediterranean phage uvMED]|nr:DNA methylase N-4/N-6 [uncultured Mediterranean phage uvMED]
MSKKKDVVSIADLVPDDRNANTGTERGASALEHSLRQYGAGRSVLVDRNNRIIAGNKTIETAASIGLEDAVLVETTGDRVVVVRRADIDLDSPEGRGLAIADNRAGELNLAWNQEILAELGEEIDLSPYFFEDELDFSGIEEPVEGLTDEDDVPEVGESPVSERGDVWILGNHRVMCGDSTDAGDVALLMDGKKAQLVHADPPYGMGKESEGVENDNLYREKLDAFQMQWWGAFRPHIEDNASAYIWGNAEGLWRLWYSGGLCDSERMTFRNEIVWDKREDNPTMLVSGVPLKSRRMYQPTERALFFMLGEQGFNNNADNYWEGWEPIRAYLKGERDAMGWNNKTVAGFFGFHPSMADHWFSESQWSFIKHEQYNRLKSEAGGAAFKREYDDLKREYDDLKREFYSTRSHFDNTHDNMTDVWSYPRVQGDDRHGHATPKPVETLCRIMKSSASADGLTVEPFLGSGSTLIAAEKTSRKCYGMEISPAYVDVIIKRWQDFTGKVAVHENGRTYQEMSDVRS